MFSSFGNNTTDNAVARLLDSLVSFKNLFIARVDFQINKLYGFNQFVGLEPGMMTDAEIITQDATILKTHQQKLQNFIVTNSACY